MKSLTDLNAWSAVQIEYDDQRDPALVLRDPLASTAGVIALLQGEEHTAVINIDLTEIIRPEILSLVLTIDLTQLPGGTATWSNIPAGLGISNPNPGIYQVSGISTLAHWQWAKAPIIGVDPAFVGFSQYTSTLATSIGISYTAVTALSTNNVTFFTPSAEFYYTSNSSQFVVGAPNLLVTSSTQWTVTVSASVANTISNMFTLGSGGTSTYAAGVLTITGTPAQINSHLNTLNIVTTLTATVDQTLLYVASNASNTINDTTQQTLTTLEYISAVPGPGNYTLNTTGIVGNTPQITNVRLDTNASPYTLTVTPSNAGAVNNLNAPEYVDYVFGQSVVNTPQNPIGGLNRGLYGTNTDAWFQIGGTGPDVLLFSNTTAVLPGEINYSGMIKVYTKNVAGENTSPFFGTQNLTPPAVNKLTGGLGAYTTVDGTGSYIASTAPRSRPDNQLTDPPNYTNITSYGAVLIWAKNASNQWTYQTRLDMPEAVELAPLPRFTANRTWSFGYYPKFNKTGDHLIVGSTRYLGEPSDQFYTGALGSGPAVHVYTRSGSTWSRLTTISTPHDIFERAFVNESYISSDGNTIIMQTGDQPVTRPAPSGTGTITIPQTGISKVYVFNKSGTEYQLTQTLEIPFTTESSRAFGLIYDYDQNTDQMYIADRSSGVFTYNIYARNSVGNFVFLRNVNFNGRLPLFSNDYQSAFITTGGAGSQTIDLFKLVNNSWVSSGVVETITASSIVDFMPSYSGHGLISPYPTQYEISYLDLQGVAFNNTTKTLTLTGTKGQVNSMLNNMTFTPVTGFNDTLNLTYTVTTPQNNTDSRVQNLRRT